MLLILKTKLFERFYTGPCGWSETQQVALPNRSHHEGSKATHWHGYTAHGFLLYPHSDTLPNTLECFSQVNFPFKCTRSKLRDIRPNGTKIFRDYRLVWKRRILTEFYLLELPNLLIGSKLWKIFRFCLQNTPFLCCGVWKGKKKDKRDRSNHLTPSQQ